MKINQRFEDVILKRNINNPSSYVWKIAIFLMQSDNHKKNRHTQRESTVDWSQ